MVEYELSNLMIVQYIIIRIEYLTPYHITKFYYYTQKKQQTTTTNSQKIKELHSKKIEKYYNNLE